MIIKRNWRDAHPTIAHQSGVDWRLLSSAIKTSGDIEESALDPQCRCLKAITLTDSSHLLVLILKLLRKKLLSSFITKSGCSSGIQ